MEVGEKYVLPSFFEGLFGNGGAKLAVSECVYGFCFDESSFGTTVAELDSALGGVATGKYWIDLMINDRKRVAD